MLEDQINKDYVQSMKDKDKLRSTTVNFLRAQMKNVRIEKKCDQLEDSDVIAVIKKQVKQRQDSIEQFTKADRKDLADKEEQELWRHASGVPAFSAIARPLRENNSELVVTSDTGGEVMKFSEQETELAVQGLSSPVLLSWDSTKSRVKSPETIAPRPSTTDHRLPAGARRAKEGP